MKWANVKLVFLREVRDQLRDRRTLFMIAVLPLLLYPALGIGMVQMTVMFSEQARTVVLLGEEFLPEDPALLDENGFSPEWFGMGTTESDKIEVITEREVQLDSDDPNAVEQQARERLRRSQLLVNAEGIRDRVLKIRALELAEGADGATEKSSQLKQLRSEVSALFSVNDMQALVIIPDGFGSNLRHTEELLAQNKTEELAQFKYARPIIVQNSAADKSMIAYQRVREAMANWENAILHQRLSFANLPPTLHVPVNIAQVDLAEEDQIAANVWSKIFPAMLIIMTVTGAFYPAIDLGAGEKERGTMETLLISPASRAEIVTGKFLTVGSFSIGTALLNLLSMGITGKYMVSIFESAGSQGNKLANLAFPPINSLVWLFVLMVPLAALFSAICLALATFARSSKEGQYYLTPLLMVTMGLTVFCLSPAVEINPFFSIVPVVNIALLLKGLLLSTTGAGDLLSYALPVLISSSIYSLLALWWAIEMFASENVLFREAERFELGLWLRHVMQERGEVPTFMRAGLCFVLIMFLQFGAMRFMHGGLQDGDVGLNMMKLLMKQQVLIIAGPALLLGLLLTTNWKRTFKIKMPHPKMLAAGIILPIALHPISIEMGASLQGWFFPPLPDGAKEVMKTMAASNVSLWFTLLAFAVAPAICEEIAFRGYILTGFQSSQKKRVAIALSALLFGIMHLIPQQVFNASLMGLALGLIAVRSQSLIPCMVFHFIYNMLGVLHGRHGTSISTNGIFGYFFRVDSMDGGGMLRYQTLLLLMATIVILAILRGLVHFQVPESEDSESAETPALAVAGTATN